MKSEKEETMMTAKLINVEGSKIKIELILELSRSMLDTEINIQKGLNEGRYRLFSLTLAMFFIRYQMFR
jgi:hypothetical protein